MEQRVSLVTLGVTDLGRASTFYAALGWRGEEVQDTVFFRAGGLAVVLWSREALAADTGVPAGTPGPFTGVVLAHNVRSRAEVDAVTDAAEAAGAEITRRPTETFYGGYAGAFLDPEGHAWEIAHNPGFGLAEDGALVLPDLGGRPVGGEDAPG